MDLITLTKVGDRNLCSLLNAHADFIVACIFTKYFICVYYFLTSCVPSSTTYCAFFPYGLTIILRNTFYESMYIFHIENKLSGRHAEIGNK